MAKEHPILFCTEMVRAILDGRKTVTRRVITEISPHYKVARKPQSYGPNDYAFIDMADPIGTYPTLATCRYGGQGDLLWTRETKTLCPGTVALYYDGEYLKPKNQSHQDWLNNYSRSKVPSIHMPKSAARLWLEIVRVRAERLQKITFSDLRAEGLIFDVGAANQGYIYVI